MITMKKMLFAGVIVIILIAGALYFNFDKATTKDTTGGNKNMNSEEKSDREKAEEYAEKMKPKVEETLRKEDIHHFIKTITFEKDIEINSMGRIIIDGYVNGDPEKFHFSADLIYNSNKVDGMSFSKDLGDRFENWDDFDKEVKEDFLNSLSKEEREQYLKDIGEIK
ncbi:DUF1433 domain-containing protein [Bacillus atrophaeus]|uniref:DUF1433 domain-containing protein n=1 Tax=Bacillus atrophaeus TaxID=1452 RepID=UPI000B456380|nr:DUF1433 domain-containing protein [Bacillus atrophaeus]ARW08969.1 hypothetical protein S101359_03991 [Bacillus atrophaeus]